MKQNKLNSCSLLVRSPTATMQTSHPQPMHTLNFVLKDRQRVYLEKCGHINTLCVNENIKAVLNWLAQLLSEIDHLPQLCQGFVHQLLYALCYLSFYCASRLGRRLLNRFLNFFLPGQLQFLNHLGGLWDNFCIKRPHEILLRLMMDITVFGSLAWHWLVAYRCPCILTCGAITNGEEVQLFLEL